MADKVDASDWMSLPKCNAQNQRKSGFCQAAAGLGTDHLGEGRCWMHGGKPDKANEAVPFLAERVRKLSAPDTEALMTMGTNAMVLARARLMERMLQDGLSTKEISDLTMSIQRLDKVLGDHLDNEDPDAAPNANNGDHLNDELKRLIALEQSTS